MVRCVLLRLSAILIQNTRSLLCEGASLEMVAPREKEIKTTRETERERERERDSKEREREKEKERESALKELPHIGAEDPSGERTLE